MNQVEIRRFLGCLEQPRYFLDTENFHFLVSRFRCPYLLTYVTAQQPLTDTIFQGLRKHAVVVFHRLVRQASLSVSTAIQKGSILVPDHVGRMQFVKAQDSQLIPLVNETCV